MDRLFHHPHPASTPLEGARALSPRELAAPAAPARQSDKGHVLVPIRLDRSKDETRTALAMAASLRPGARVSLLHVHPPRVHDESSYHWLDAIERLHGALAPRQLAVIAKAREVIQARIESDVPAGLRASLKLHAECRVGEPAEEIARFASAQAVDLVILCSKPGAWRWPFRPRLSQRILRLTDKPVLVIHPASHPPRSPGASVPC